MDDCLFARRSRMAAVGERPKSTSSVPCLKEDDCLFSCLLGLGLTPEPDLRPLVRELSVCPDGADLRAPPPASLSGESLPLPLSRSLPPLAESWLEPDCGREPLLPGPLP